MSNAKLKTSVAVSNNTIILFAILFLFASCSVVCKSRKELTNSNWLLTDFSDKHRLKVQESDSFILEINNTLIDLQYLNSTLKGAFKIYDDTCINIYFPVNKLHHKTNSFSRKTRNRLDDFIENNINIQGSFIEFEYFRNTLSGCKYFKYTGNELLLYSPSNRWFRFRKM